ncbi:MAG: type II secretion system protein [Verrucomicrobiota bacterium]
MADMNTMHTTFSSRKAGFSLTELMVAIAIIVILMLLFLPALWPNLERAKKMQCRSNLRQMGMACFLHAKDQEDASLGGATYDNGNPNGTSDGRGGWSQWADP